VFALTCHNVTVACSSPGTLYPDDRLTRRDRSGMRDRTRILLLHGVKSPSYTILPGRLLGSDVHEACEEKREKARGRGWIDSGAAISMRYYALPFCTTWWKRRESLRRWRRRRHCRRSRCCCHVDINCPVVKAVHSHITRAAKYIQLRPA